MDDKLAKVRKLQLIYHNYCWFNTVLIGGSLVLENIYHLNNFGLFLINSYSIITIAGIFLFQAKIRTAKYEYRDQVYAHRIQKLNQMQKIAEQIDVEMETLKHQQPNTYQDSHQYHELMKQQIKLEKDIIEIFDDKDRMMPL